MADAKAVGSSPTQTNPNQAFPPPLPTPSKGDFFAYGNSLKFLWAWLGKANACCVAIALITGVGCPVPVLRDLA